MNIFLCFYILLKFPGRHPRSPCSNTSVSQPQSLPVYCLITIICNKRLVQCISLLLWINLSPIAKCISMLPQKYFPFSPQFFFFLGEVWMYSILLWIFCTASSPAGINLSCPDKPSSHMTRNPSHLCSAWPDTALYVCSQSKVLKELLNQTQGFWKYTRKEKKS